MALRWGVRSHRWQTQLCRSAGPPNVMLTRTSGRAPRARSELARCRTEGNAFFARLGDEQALSRNKPTKRNSSISTWLLDKRPRRSCVGCSNSELAAAELVSGLQSCLCRLQSAF